jgi:NAD dependent epimerase/dehydratase family enzyme
MARAAAAPKILISASAVGYYGNGGDKEFSESDPPGAGFLAATALARTRLVARQ